MKLIAKLAFKSVHGSIDPEKKDNSFEVNLDKVDTRVGLHDRREFPSVFDRSEYKPLP